jgi:hypothetical protein
MLTGDAKVGVACCICGSASWSVRDECVLSCLRSRSVRENRLWQSRQECRASFVSTRSQLPFTWMLPVCTYVRRAHAGQGSLVASMSFGIVYTRALSSDLVAVYAFSVWMIGEGMEKVGGTGQRWSGVGERRWTSGWRAGRGGVAGGVRGSVWVEWHLLLLAQDHTSNIYAPEYGNMHDGHLSIVLFSGQGPITTSFSAFFTDNTHAIHTAWLPLKYSVPCHMI